MKFFFDDFVPFLLGVLVVITLVVTGFFKGCERANGDGLQRAGYRLICLGGHAYYKGYSVLAPKLNDDGTPCECAVE